MVRLSFRIFASVLLSSSLGCAAIAQETEAEPIVAGSDNSIIIVEGTQTELREQLRSMLDTKNKQIARLETAFCPLIMGYDRDYTQTLYELIGGNVEPFGIEMKPRGCRPNAIIVFIQKPHELVAAFRAKLPGVFRGMSPREIDQLLRGRSNSYAWHLIGQRDRNGAIVAERAVTRSFSASRLTTSTSLDLTAGFLIMDIDRTEGMTLRQLADFITVQLLADLRYDVSARSRPGSILRLFEELSPTGAAPQMTAFEQSMLTALYAGTRNNVSAMLKRGRMAQIMKKSSDDAKPESNASSADQD